MAKPIFKWHDGIWNEKYRPKNIDDFILNSEYKRKFKEFLENKSIPNLLLEGIQGVGKSSLADLFITNLPCEVKVLNGSTDRGIEVVRDIITPFVTTSSFESLKIIVLEEGDKLTPDAQDALKTLTEQFTSDVRFIITCNNVDLLIPPLRSRFQEFHISPPTKEQVIKRCKLVLEKEKIGFDEEELDTIVRYHYPDIRKCITYLDQHSSNGELRLDREFFQILKYESEILKTLKTTNSDTLIDDVFKIRKLIANTRIKSFITLYKFLFSQIDEFLSKKQIINGILIIHQGIKDDTKIPDKEINLITTITKLLELKNG